jgi:hypothetical protein
MKIIEENLKLLSHTELCEYWNKFFEAPFPEHLHKKLIIKHILWQEKHGGYSPQIDKKLQKLVSQYEQNKKLPDKIEKTNLFNAGTKFIREFKGEKHEVIALEKGFQYQGRMYKSLSAIANEITGTRWNGKKFFGVCK